MMIRTTQKLRMAGVFAAGAMFTWALGGIGPKDALATPSQGVTTTIVVGPTLLGEGHVKSESDINEVEFEAKGASDLYVVHNKIVPGGHTGWHSHPGISFVMVRAGAATEYHGDDPKTPHVYPKGTCLVEQAGQVHLIRNEGDTDLELVAFQIIPFGATRRIDAPAP
jgi:quercetin dioxygenase-like cupin family protein